MSSPRSELSILILAGFVALALPAHSEPFVSERTWEHRLADAQFALAARSFEGKDDREALARLGAALRLDPSHWQARYRLHSFLTQRRYALPLSEWSVPGPSTAQLGDYGKVLLTFSPEYVTTLWNPQTGRAIGQPLKFANAYSSYFSPGGDFVVGENEAHQLLVIDAKTGAPVPKLTAITSVEFSGKGRRAFVELRKPRGSVLRAVWNTSSGQLQDLDLRADEEVQFACFTQDEEKLIVALRAPKSKLLRVITWPAFASSGNGGRSGVMVSTDEKPNCISADGSIIGLNEDSRARADSVKTVLAWSTETGAPVSFPEGMDRWMPPPASAREIARSRTPALSPDGSLAVTASIEGTATVREIHQPSETSNGDAETPTVTILPHPFRLDWAAFRPDGSELVTVGRRRQGIRSVAVRNWVLTSPPSAAEIQRVGYVPKFSPHDTESEDQSLFAARFLPGGDAIALFFRDGTMRLWKPWRSPEPGAIIPVVRSRDFEDTKFSNEGAVMAIPLENNQILLWDFAKEAPLGSAIPPQPMRDFRFHTFCLSGNGEHLATTDYDPSADKRSVSIWDTTTQRLVRTLPIDTGGELYLSGDGRRLATEPMGTDGIVVFDVETGRPLTAPLWTSFSPPPVVLNRDGTALTLKDNYWLDLLNLSHPSLQTTEWQSLQTETSDAGAFSPDGKLLAAAPDALWVFHTDNGQPVLGPLGGIDGARERIDAITFSPDGRLLASHSKSGVVVREAATGLALTELLPGHGEFYIDSICFDSTGTKLLVAGEKLDYFDLAGPVGEDSAELATLAEGIAGQQVDLNTDRLQFLDSLPVITQLRAKHPDWPYFQALKARANPPIKK